MRSASSSASLPQVCTSELVRRRSRRHHQGHHSVDRRGFCTPGSHPHHTPAVQAVRSASAVAVSQRPPVASSAPHIRRRTSSPTPVGLRPSMLAAEAPCRRGSERVTRSLPSAADLLLKVVACHAMTLLAARHRTQMRKRELHAASPGLAIAARRCRGESIDTRFVRDRGSHRPNDVADRGRQLTSAEY
jgi:hypothetical protein